ncbi:MAG: hypothetical protein A2176_13050 [Spirochaetes bacterium RBG_13_51_14]|nr:MAG: hypothetical protein A2176_13050 [Spirochaetes bacterium RBG_13_51_14]
MPPYDIIIIGSGPAGYTAGFAAVKYGLKAAIIERDLSRLGGVCLSEGCIPLKGLIYHARSKGGYGAVRDLVMERVEQIRSGLKSRLQAQGVDLIQGRAVFASRDELRVDGESFAAKHYIIAVGSSPKRHFYNPTVHTSETIFELDAVPERILIIGGGVVGCEYASFLSAVGAKVDIVELLDSPLYGEDEETVRVLLREFKKRNIDVFAKSRIADIGTGGEVIIENGKKIRNTYGMIFETTGRVPNTADLGLEAAGVKRTDKGFIAVNEFLQTSAGTVYAAGDCIDTPMLAYAAAREAETAVRHLATGTAMKIDYAVMPRLVFASPQVGSVGRVADRAVERNGGLKIYKYFFRALGKPVMEGRDVGFVKLAVDRDADTIIGASAVGDDIADIMNLLALIVKSGMKVTDIKECMFVHPSYSEIIVEALQYGG